MHRRTIEIPKRISGQGRDDPALLSAKPTPPLALRDPKGAEPRRRIEGPSRVPRCRATGATGQHSVRRARSTIYAEAPVISRPRLPLRLRDLIEPGTGTATTLVTTEDCRRTSSSLERR